MATEKQMAAIEKMRAAKKAKAEERARQQQIEQQQQQAQDEDFEQFEDENDDDEKHIRESVQQSPIGHQIEEELKSLYESNNRNLSAQELKSKAPKSYNAIFESYADNEDNGVETSRYRARETNKHQYTIEKL